MKQKPLTIPQLEAQLIDMKTALNIGNGLMLTSPIWTDVHEAKRQMLIKHIEQGERLIAELRK